MVAAGGAVARSFAGASELTRAQLLDAPVHWPRPSALDIVARRRWRASARSSPRPPPKPASRRSATCCCASRTATATARWSRSAALRGRRAGDGPGRGAGRQPRAVPAPRPVDRRGESRRRVRLGQGDLVQPALAGRRSSAGDSLAATGSRDKRGFRVSEYEIARGGGWGCPSGRLGFSPGGEAAAAERSAKNRTPRAGRAPPPSLGQLVPVHPATESLKAQRIREWMEQAVGWVGQRDRAAAGGAAGAAGACRGPPMRSRRCTFPETRRTSRQRAGAAGVRGAVPLPGGAGDPEQSHRTARPAPKLGKPGELVGAGSRRCRSSRRGISCGPSTRSTRTSTPASRCSGC